VNKILIGLNKKNEILKYDKKNIHGYIINLKNYGVFYNLDLTLKSILNLKTNKELYININKMLFNKDIKKITRILKELEKIKANVIFEDMAIFNIVKKNNLNINLIYNQIHFATNYLSINFLEKRNVNNVVLSTEITLKDIKKIKKNTNSKIFGYCYGKVPILYSNRSLLTNYFNYNKMLKEKDKYYIKAENDSNYYLIEEKNKESIIYSNVINLGKYSNVFDYVILNDINEEIVDSYINKKYSDLNYNFLFKETIYKVK